MKCLTSDQVKAWWSHYHSFTKLPLERGEWPSERTSRFLINLDTLPAARLRFVAVSVVRWLTELEPEQMLVWVFECGIWGSSEDWNLYQIFREARAGRSYMEDGSGHVFMLHEREDAASLLFMAMAFGWGVVVGSSIGRSAFSFDHDGHTHVWSDDDQARNTLTKSLGKMD